MFKTSIYQARRKALSQRVGSGVILFLGNDEVGMNYKDNTYSFRQDSTFLYFFGIDRPGLSALIDIDQNKEIIFGQEHTLDDIIWMGSHTSVADQVNAVGVQHVYEPSQLKTILSQALSSKRAIHFTPPYRSDNVLKLHALLDKPIQEIPTLASMGLIQAIIELRSIKSAEEINQIELALSLTKKMHEASMRTGFVGVKESELTALVMQIAAQANVALAYPIILTTQGQTLHNHDHSHVLKENDLVLGDFGAESPLHYASDVTRTYPAAKKFSTQQKDIYQIVLDAQTVAIGNLRPGVLYRDVHLTAARTLAAGLKNLGIMKGNTDEAVAAGAHAMFFPHGLGHMMGLDVHDMEDLGEIEVGYTSGMKRSDQFGLKYLRLARALESGFVLTVEPGIYFIPELIDQWQSQQKHKEFINYDQVAKYRNLGGIRIEDNCFITSTGGRVLGEPIAKTIAEIETIRC